MRRGGWVRLAVATLVCGLAGLAFAAVTMRSGYRQSSGWAAPALAAGALGVSRSRGLRIGLPVAATLPPIVWFGLAPVPTAAAVVGVAVGFAWQSRSEAARMGIALRDSRVAVEVLREQQRTSHEREALARELHDVIGHHMTSVVVLAEAAQLGQTSDQDVLPGIADAARAALDELDVLLRGLRQPIGSAAEPSTTGHSTLGDRLPQLLKPLQAIGIDATTHIDVAADLPRGVELAAYRVVQEALTNVLRHADATRVSVHAVQAEGVLRLTVDDDGNGNALNVESDRSGLRGMAERAAGERGRVAVLAGPLGGTRVQVELSTGELWWLPR